MATSHGDFAALVPARGAGFDPVLAETGMGLATLGLRVYRTETNL
jgi:hypothetical protein